MKKLVIFIVTILVFGVLAMITCVQNSHRIQEEKNKNEIANIENEVVQNIIPEEIIEEVTEVEDNKQIEKEETRKEETRKEEIKKEETKKEEVKQEIKQEVKQEETQQVEKEEPVVEQTKQEENYSEQIVIIAEKKECKDNEHGIKVGNTGQWFETKDSAIEVYNQKIKEWGDKWTNYEIDNETYYKNCPSGYEIFSCPFCNKWTINLFY